MSVVEEMDVVVELDVAAHLLSRLLVHWGDLQTETLTFLTSE